MRDVVLLFSLVTLNRFHTMFWCSRNLAEQNHLQSETTLLSEITFSFGNQLKWLISTNFEWLKSTNFAHINIGWVGVFFQRFFKCRVFRHRWMTLNLDSESFRKQIHWRVVSDKLFSIQIIHGLQGTWKRYVFNKNYK